MKYIIGIDEVGRGALAGPVVVSAAAIGREFRIENKELRKLGKLKDSKKLSAKRRGAWFAYFKKHPKVFYTIAKVHARTIDGMNISQAANVAALRAFEQLTKTYNLKLKTSTVFLDGGLFLGNRKNHSTHSLHSGRMTVKTVIRGDEKIRAIKIASIMAKVYRDRFMKKIGKVYPQYNFETHKGYGTKLHRKAIKRHGLSEIHRKSFKLAF